jgi:hypothetical protein
MCAILSFSLFALKTGKKSKFFVFSYPFTVEFYFKRKNSPYEYNLFPDKRPANKKSLQFKKKRKKVVVLLQNQTNL